jgi:hypothetical protein
MKRVLEREERRERRWSWERERGWSWGRGEVS